MKVRTTVGGFPKHITPLADCIIVESDELVAPSVAIDVWHDDPREFLAAHDESGLVAYPSVHQSDDGNRCVAFFSVQSGPVRIVHWDATRCADEDEFAAAWRERVLDG